MEEDWGIAGRIVVGWVGGWVDGWICRERGGGGGGIIFLVC